MAATVLSVVIGSHDAAAVIDTCLEALESQRRGGEVEVIVSDSSTDGTPDRIRGRFPWVRLIHHDEPVALAGLRGRGIAAANGDLIAILDPYSVASSDWADQVIETHRRQSHPIIGGSVGLHRAETRSLAEWTLYFNEYALFLPPVVRGETWIVPGSNVVYKRRVLFDGNRPRYPIFWKTFANWDIERAGSPLWLEPAVHVDLNKPIPLGSFLRTRYDHGRCFAGIRVRDRGWPTRVLRVLSTPLVPPLLMWRWTRGYWPKRRYRGRFLLTVPAQLTLSAVWAWGEAWGYARGSGRCCDHIFY
jgi:glycosyltransferase involved in cell wall biosynthesis